VIVAGAQPTSECPMVPRANDVHGRVLTVQVADICCADAERGRHFSQGRNARLKFDICSGLTSTPADMQPRGLDRQDG
jgi:hypothetical protein